MLCVDLDDFRLVNDSLGHTIGDDVLRVVAERLREATRETDLVARRGGDQFLLLLADLERDERGDMDAAMIRAEAVAQRINASLRRRSSIEGTELYVSASMGISLFPQDARATRRAPAQRRGRDVRERRRPARRATWCRHGRLRLGAKLQFVTRLRKAVDTQRWTLHYQPVIELATGGMVGVEALIRWIEPDGTMVPPIEFIPLAEELGLIEQIGDWVVREIVYQVARVDGARHRSRDRLQPVAPPVLAAGPRRADPRARSATVASTRAVLVEVTESSAMMDPDRAQEILLGAAPTAVCAIAIDDFGTGYSSLSRLREMPVESLKIDRSFVSGVDAGPAVGQRSSTAFLELARGLGMTTLAEGIETAEELAFLRERGCKLGQGFFFSKPVPPEEIIAYAFGGVPAASTLGADVLAGDRLANAAATIDAASIPAHARSSSGVPEPGMSCTPSLTTRPASGPVAASASSTASPSPPSTRWSSTTTIAPVSSSARRNVAASIGFTL